MATESELEFTDREQNNEQLLEIIQMRRENSGGDAVPVQFVDTGEANDGNGALILQSQEIELNGERHVILQQAQDSETGELLVVLQGANGEPIALSSEALSSVQGLVQVSGAEGEQVITLAVSQENNDQHMVVVSDPNNSTATVAVPIDSLSAASPRFSLSTSVNKTVSNICNPTNASTNVVQSVETPRMTTHQEQSSCEPIIDKSVENIGERLNENVSQAAISTDEKKSEVDDMNAQTESNLASTDTDKVEKESVSIGKLHEETNDQKTLDSTPGSVDFTSAVIQVQDSNGNASLETLMANAVVSAADNNYVVMTTEDSGISTEINLADMISAGSATGQTFFIETSEGLVACTSASTAEDGSIQLVADGGASATALLSASQADGQVLQSVAGNQPVTYTLQTTASGIELTPVTNLQSPLKQPSKPKPVRQTKPKPISTTRSGETLLLPSSVTSKTVVTPVPLVSANPKNRGIPLRNTKSATGVHVTVTPQSSYSSTVIPVQPDNSSSHLKSNTKTATSTSVASMLTSSTQAASQLAASRRTYSKKNNIVWLNPEQTTVTTVSRSPTSSANTTTVSLSSPATTPVKNKTTVSVFSGTKSSIPPSGLTIVKTDIVTNDSNVKTSNPLSSSPEKKRDSPATPAVTTVKVPAKESPKHPPPKEEMKSVIVSKNSSVSSPTVEPVNKVAKVTVPPVSPTKPAIIEPPKSSKVKAVEVVPVSKDNIQEEKQKSEAKPPKSEKTKDIERKTQETVESRENRKKVEENNTDDTKSTKTSNTRSSKQKNVTVEPVVASSKIEKSDTLSTKLDKKTTLDSKDAQKPAEVNSVRVEPPKESEKRKEKRTTTKVDDVADNSKVLKHSKSRVQNKSKSEASNLDTKSKVPNVEKATTLEIAEEKLKDTPETKQKEPEKKNVESVKKDKKTLSDADKKDDQKEVIINEDDKVGDSEKRSTIKRKTEEISEDQKAIKLSKTRSSKSKEAKVEVTPVENECSKVSEDNSSSVTLETEPINIENKTTASQKEVVKDDSVEGKKDEVKTSTVNIDENIASEKSNESERRTRDSKRKSEEISNEKSTKVSKPRSSKVKQPEVIEPKETELAGSNETKASKNEHQESKGESEKSQNNDDPKTSDAETPIEKRTREAKKKSEQLNEDSKSTKTTKLKVNFKLDENDSPMEIGNSEEPVSARKRRRRQEPLETPKREQRGSRRSALKTPEPEKIVPILKKTRSTPVATRSVERVCIVKSYSNDVDEQTEEIEKQRVVSSINDSRSPAERYDFTSNECHFHIRHQSTSLSPFTPRGSGGSYMCQKCGYKTSRMNNLVLHHKDQCPVVKSAVMSFWANEIRKQTRKPSENSTPVIDDHVAKKITLDLDAQSNENYDSEEEMEDDEEEKPEILDPVIEEKSKDVKPAHETVLMPSDDEDEAAKASDAVKKCFGFDEKEIVWADWEGIFWPALVVKLHDKHKDVTVKWIENTYAGKCVKMSADKVKPFDNAEVNKRLLSEGKAVNGDIVKAVQKAEDYSRKRCLGDESGAAKLFEDLNEFREPLSDEERLDDERLGGSVVENNGTKSDGILGAAVVESDDSSDLRELIENSAQWKERRRISNSKLLQCIKDGKIENHLLGVYRETIPSDRHIKFKSGSDAEKSQLKHVPWFGPIDDEDQQEEIYDYCSQLFKSNFKPDGSFDTVAYLFEVWVPEAIVKAISRIRRIELQDAEGIFAKGVILSKSEKVELEKEILKEAEKQATTNTSTN